MAVTNGKILESRPLAGKTRRYAAVVVALQLAALVSACNEHQDARTGTNAQNAQFTADKQTELAQATGNPDKSGNASATYVGTVKMFSSNTTYDCQLVVNQDLQIQHAASATSPVETVEVPGITATLSFPFLSNIKPFNLTDRNSFNVYADALKKYSDLSEATGQIFVVAVSNGDFVVKDHNLYLPYTVTGQTASGNWGEIKLRLENGRLKGKWTTTTQGEVGEFNLVRK